MIDPAKKVHGQIKSILGDKSEVVGVQGRDIVDIGTGVRAIASSLVGEVRETPPHKMQWLMVVAVKEWVYRS